ncbi:MAG: NAD(P) transhydrogenase subunit alpha [Alphaproteobacteria bacterium]|nr:NAD(P) transhydrogenase subunit alpha [Alphaproteobacteria bacterium]
MKIFVASEESDNRIAVVPEVAKKLIALGYECVVEERAGANAGFADYEYENVGAKIISRDNDLKLFDVVFSVNFPTLTFKDGTIIITSKIIDLSLCKKQKLTVFSLNKIPRTTRAQYMDVLSSQASLAGYKAMIEASHEIGRAIPLMMTTAGTIPAAKVLIIGAGVAGLQAIATAKRLGGVVSAFDVRASAKEQVESLGAKFIEVKSEEKIDGVYAKEMGEEYKKAQEKKLREILPSQDIVITTAQIPGKRAPVIIKKDMVETMKSGAVIVDLSVSTGGNCEATVPGQTVEQNGVKILGFNNILDLIANDASRLYAKNVFNFFELLMSQMEIQPDISKINDDIIKSTLIAHNGNIYNT